MKKRFKEEVARVVDKYLYQLPFLNALIMWSHNPTSMSAGYGFEDNIPCIEKNISLMFPDENPESIADATYQDLIKLGELFRQLHGEDRDSFYMTFDEILKYVYSKYSSHIILQIIETVRQSKDFMTLALADSFKEFLKREGELKSGPSSSVKFRPSSLDYFIENKDINSIYRIFKDRTNREIHSLDPLITVGLLYQMYYRSVSGKTNKAVYLLPMHVPEALSTFDIPKLEKPPESEREISSFILPERSDILVQPLVGELQSIIIWKYEKERAEASLVKLIEGSDDLICIVDRYIDHRTLTMVQNAVLNACLNKEVIVKILTEKIHYSDRTKRTLQDIKSDFPNLLIKRIEENQEFKNPFHDRYLLTPIVGFQIGTSIKYLGGYRLSAISRLSDDDNKALLDFFHNIWNNVGMDFP